MSTLRHLVFFEFKAETGEPAIQEVCDAFGALPSKVSEIRAYEAGLNNSPEGLAGGFTHCFQLTFRSEADRDAYLVHPEHKAFQRIADPRVKRVMVFDYWTEQ